MVINVAAIILILGLSGLCFTMLKPERN